MTFPYHPLANLFPLIEGEEFEALVASIAARGLREPVVLFDGMVLDGRNRQRACDAAKVVCRYDIFHDAKDALAFVVDKNLRRRHLNDSQRAYAAANLATMRQGARTDLRPAEETQPSADLPEVSQDAAAAMMHVSPRSVRSAVVVRDKGSEDLKRAVQQGKIAVSAAVQAAALAPHVQARIVREAEAGRANAAKLVIKQERRAKREQELGARQWAKPEGVFGVLLEDFEWDFETRSEAGMDRHAGNHYEVARDAHTPEEIVARTAERFVYADENCVLFMCATNPHLAVAIHVMELRGFTYVSNYALEKDRIITGFWSRGKHELMLIGVKGDVPCPAPGTQWESVIKAPVGAHSAKPELIHEMIEAYFPTWRKLELNRRGPARSGWSAWGNEVSGLAAIIAEAAE